MEKRIVKEDSLGFLLYTLWLRTLFKWICQESTDEIKNINSESIKDSCSYKYWVIFNLLTLPAYLILNLAQSVAIVIAFLVFGIVYIVALLIGFWFTLDDDNLKKVWYDSRFHIFYPYKYCPWTGGYLRFAPWQIILPLVLLYSLLFLRRAIYKTVIVASSGMSMFFSNHIFWGVVLLLTFSFFLFKIWRSGFVKELREDIKRKYCIPVKLVKTEKKI